MAELNGYIKLHRKMLNWGWYDEPATKAVFLHLLLTANFKEGEYRGHKVEPGQTVVGRKKMSSELGLSEQQVRTALDHLKNSGEISIKSTSRFSIITIENWAMYQGCCDDDNQQITNKQPTSNQQATNKQPTSNQQITNNQPHLKNDKNDKNVKNDKKVKKEKKIYGEYGHVRLSDDECEKLKAEYGEVLTDEAVVYLDEYIEMKGYKAKSHYLAIRKWVVSAVKEQKARNKKNGGNELLDMINGGVFDDFPL